MSTLQQAMLRAAAAAAPWTREMRQDLHRHPELGWCEFRTAGIVAREMRALGCRVRLGDAAVAPGERLGLPAAPDVEAAWSAALAAGLPVEFLAPMRGGLTGVVADLDCGRPGPTLAFRVDMDALPIAESSTAGHPPAQEGWASTAPGRMHACGHDGHTAIGLGAARVMAALAPRLCGRVRFLFQPAEEGGRGGRAMAAAGVCDSVDYLLAVHLGLGVPAGTVAAGCTGFLASTKLQARFTGRAAHAGLRPEEGRNALLAAAQAALALHHLPQHGSAVARVNVGVLQAGTMANTVPGHAVLHLETRSDRTEVNTELEERAAGCIHGAAAMYGCSAEVTVTGRARAEDSHPALAALVAEVAGGLPGVRDVRQAHAFGASEDATFLMADVHRQGGQAAYAVVGSPVGSGHHTPGFHFEDGALETGVALLAGTAVRLLGP